MIRNPAPKCTECSVNCLIKEISEENELTEISEKKAVEVYHKGSLIFREDDEIQYIGFVYSGKIKIFKSGNLGKSKILRFTTKGDVLGHRGLNLKTYPVSAEAIEDAVICSMSKTAFMELLKRQYNLTLRFLLYFADELNHSELHERNLAQMTVPEKIADTLLYMKEVFGENNNKELDVLLSRKEIAEYAGTTKEQVSKYLSDLDNDKIIEVRAKHIRVLDINRLRSTSAHSTSK